ncbi:Peptidase family S41 [Algoriphagus locisalis]|uniref:Peptidase family S41 n=2 Tax=Algoriphagus locisalis TaxID=305507 RepID=A0A1I7CCC2_9BACT|nr:Peptidase family S41 [Algoriphagus locisalis]
MNLIRKSLFCYLIMVSFILSCHAQNNQEINNLVSFAKAYGYVKYFHPSTEADQVDWGWFSVYGSEQVMQCENTEELLQTMQRIFEPIAPTVSFSFAQPSADYPIEAKPTNEQGYLLVYWQHFGVSRDMNKGNPLYRSIKVNSLQKTDGNETPSGETQESNPNKKAGKDELAPAPPLFQGSPKENENWTAQIGKELWISMPLLLYSKDGQTFPKSTTDIEEFMVSGEQTTATDASSLSFRCGNLINTWNVFQHFYPYFTEMSIDWDNELKASLTRTYKSDSDGHVDDLKRLTSALKDNHVSVRGTENPYFAPPIDVAWIEGQLVITEVFDPTMGFKPGDTIEQINGATPQQLYENLRPKISAATQGWFDYIAPILMITGKLNTTLNITVAGKTAELERKLNYYAQKDSIKPSEPGYRFLEDGIVYLNLDAIPMDTINKIMPQLEKSKAIIADVRGYPNNNHELIRHLISKKDDHKWMQVDHFIYPDQQQIPGYSDFGWSMEPKDPFLGDKKVIFITDGRAVSYAESYLGFIEGYKLATIIGQPSSGTNGNVNSFTLPGDYIISFTGMRVLKHDGSQLHGIGFLPDAYVERTIEGVRAGRDEFLEKAIELAKQ